MSQAFAFKRRACLSACSFPFKGWLERARQRVRQKTKAKQEWYHTFRASPSWYGKRCHHIWSRAGIPLVFEGLLKLACARCRR